MARKYGGGAGERYGRGGGAAVVPTAGAGYLRPGPPARPGHAARRRPRRLRPRADVGAVPGCAGIVPGAATTAGPRPQPQVIATKEEPIRPSHGETIMTNPNEVQNGPARPGTLSDRVRSLRLGDRSG